MKKRLLFSIFLLFPFVLIAGPGDTTFIQTFTFGSQLDKKFLFPDNSHRWGKILMYYTLKCNPAQSPACGEWDYLTNTYLYKPTGKMDSTQYTHPNFLYNGTSPDTLPCMNQYSWKYLPWFEYFNQTNPTSIHKVGDSTGTSGSVFSNQARDARSQFLWKAGELTASGLGAGQVTGMRFKVQSAGSKLMKLTLRLKSVTLDSLCDSVYVNSGFTEVFRRDYIFQGTGWQTIPFTYPFTWNGTSNIVVDICFESQSPFPSLQNLVFTGPSGFSSSLNTNTREAFLRFHGNEYLSIPPSIFQNIDSAVSISFWQYGDPAMQPMDNTLLEGIDSKGRRIINIHLPWSNSRVYWDAGGDSTGYDRVWQPLVPSAFKGQWNHWAFTKDLKTGRMRMYLNGNLLFNQGGKMRHMKGITRFNLGCPGSADGWFYQGNLDEFCIWDKALTDTAIRSVMYSEVSPSNPDYQHLLAYYKFNEGQGFSTADSSVHNHPATLIGYPEWQSYKGRDRFRRFEVSNNRPVVVFEQGNYNQATLDSVFRIDTIAKPPIMIVMFGNSLHPILPTDTLTKYRAYYHNYVYNPQGVAIDSTLFPPDTLIRKKTWIYYGNPFEVTERFELARYITPYGNNLSMGNGWTWLFDLTDYASLLHDSVHLSAGNWQELLDMKFAMIEGIPPRDILDIQNIYTGNHGYADSSQHNLPAVKAYIGAEAKNARLKMRITGHGFGGTENCSEFCPRLNTLKINGSQVYTHYVWRPDCGLNPLYPQGGTWLYDRANWCPGAEVRTKDFELSKFVIAGDTNVIDYDLQPGYKWDGQGSWPYYQIESQLITYGKNNFALDASVEEILSPNKDVIYNRWNPMCANPVIIIKNNGADTVHSASISYGPAGGTMQNIAWNGRLGFADTARISLPPIDWTGWWGGDNRFVVNLQQVNGKTDDYVYNNSLSSGFTIPPTWDNQLVFNFKTNHEADSLSWALEDWNGNILYHNGPLDFNTTYIDTFQLEKGCYRLSIRNAYGEGLSYWANMPPYGNGTAGSATILDMEGKTIKRFQGDFGRMISQSFTVGMSIHVNEINPGGYIHVYPNPSDGHFTIAVVQEKAEAVEVSVSDAMGNLILTKTWPGVENASLSIDLKDRPAGMYVVTVTTSKGSVVKKLVVL
ncbi:MAG: peptide-N-glycosidase F-related protein [Bacteroidota bacterium]